MEIGLGLDASLTLSFDDQAQLAAEAARLGYTSLWTPEGVGQDAFQLCALRWQGSRAVAPQGLQIAYKPGVGVELAVVPGLQRPETLVVDVVQCHIDTRMGPFEIVVGLHLATRRYPGVLCHSI